jgi:L-ascorbate metabolism protein UlaG (beta-lactamase superfamily)
MRRRFRSLIPALPLPFGAGGKDVPLPDLPAHHATPYSPQRGGRFRNPHGQPQGEASMLRDRVPFFWGMTWRGWQKVAVPEGHVLDKPDVHAGLQRHHNSDSYTWLGHAAFLIRLGGATILTDPYLSHRAGPLNLLGPKRYVPSALSPDELPPVDILTVSHNHYDHLDLAALAAMPNKHRTAVFVPLGLGRYFHARGFRDITELDWYHSAERRGVTVTFTPAVHFSRRGAFDRNRSLWGGFAYHAGDKRLFFSGDTAYGPVFREIGEKLGPFDTAFVGIGAYEPQVIMRNSHTTPEQAAMLARDIGARRVVGMHWGTVVLSDEPPFEAPERLRAGAAAVGYAPGEADVMPIGATRSF